ncbi:MAG: hypothetical protein K2X57_24995 [Xanthobacteraceae bacterium]|nr:hypothetical protein [Xanthobacteraceae bacterium]
MFAQFGANFAVVRSMACKISHKRRSAAAGLTLLAIGSGVAGCTAPASLNGQDPANPNVKVAPTGYRSTVAPYQSLRPTTPSSWRQQNDRVAPSPKSEQ